MRALAATVALVLTLSACGSDGPNLSSVSTVCHEGYAFVVYSAPYKGGIVRLPEADEDCT